MKACVYSTLGTSQGVQRQKSKKVRVSKGPRLVHSFAVYLQTDALQFIPTLRFKEIGVLGTPGTQNHRSPFFQNTTEMICRKKKAQRRLELGRTCTSGTCSSAKKYSNFKFFASVLFLSKNFPHLCNAQRMRRAPRTPRMPRVNLLKFHRQSLPRPILKRDPA